MLKKIERNLLISVLAAGLFSYSAIADPIRVVDQQQDDTVQASMSIDYFSPVGQSFIPTVSKLNFVELQMSDGGGRDNGTYAYVNIRMSDIAGPIVGASNSIFLEDCFNQVEGPGCGIGGGWPVEVRFIFSQDISLLVGETYVLEIVYESGDTSLNVGHSYSDKYIDGGSYQSGQFNDRDLWFREGYTENNAKGEMHGLSGASIECQNYSTRNKVIIENYDGGDFDCAAYGLEINPGDKVKVIFIGKAD